MDLTVYHINMINRQGPT